MPAISFAARLRPAVTLAMWLTGLGAATAALPAPEQRERGVEDHGGYVGHVPGEPDAAKVVEVSVSRQL